MSTGQAQSDGAVDAARSDGHSDQAVTGLEPYRRRLDELDEQIARAFGERFQICREIALYKREHEIPMMQPGRVEQVRARYLARGEEVNLPADFTSALFELMIGATCKLEDELIDGADGAARGTLAAASAAGATDGRDAAAQGAAR